ncbi:CCA tRNA nucleotidyltransferase [Rhodobacter calidifons]|uniref:CCA tRNA nucleotidyltransferase n=1 Tax=Rhodobacter calidifons TaxID=2715277 RepID=A0ABX0G472_9RHOB|nr:CCA tRNA nucleotidyltransferase [Rhodobacter calidifons]NHB75980.1 CCA tRNA nucleotidyltransferase [Rhodobacter calidifons]
MNVAGDWLDHPGTQALMQALEAAGHQALLVGGCVRNALLREPVSDIDLATDATPQTVSDLAEAAGFKVVPTGIDHGTVTVFAHGKPHEVTTFRRDVETDGRRAVVAFSTRIEEDARRRDFTMNALYADRHGTVIDPLGGLSDLQARRVRFVGDPETRIREDYLRILRFFRFHAAYGDPDGGIDPEGLSACAALAEGLEAISRERIHAELRKLLSARDPAPAVAAMSQAGVLARVLPGADPRALAPLVHLEGAHLDAAEPPRWLRRLAVLGGDTSDLRLSRAEARDLAALREAIGSSDTPAALGWRLGADLATDAILARAASFGTPPPQDWRAEARRGATARFPVTAADLMPGLQGEVLGARLKALETRWLASDLTLSREDLLKGA